jgi:enoyl-[acyl-carrier protein] reductase II
VESAKRLEEAGADAVIAEGMESGGHIGESTTMSLVPQVVDALKIPVIAAGGIADGRGMVAAMALGAKGVQMGTRFVCSTECIAAESYKKKIIEASARSTVITRQSLGMPQRSLANSLSEQFQALESAGISRSEMEMFERNRMYLGLIEGNIDDGWLLAGQIAGIINEIKPVKTIIEDIMNQAEEVIRILGIQLKEK